MSCQAHWKYKRPLDLEFDPASLDLEFLGVIALMRFAHISRGRKKSPNDLLKKSISSSNDVRGRASKATSGCKIGWGWGKDQQNATAISLAPLAEAPQGHGDSVNVVRRKYFLRVCIPSLSS